MTKPKPWIDNDTFSFSLESPKGLFFSFCKVIDYDFTLLFCRYFISFSLIFLLRPTKSDTFLVLSLYLSLLLSFSLSLLFLSLSGCWSICMQLSSIIKKKVPYVWHCSVPTSKNIYLFNGQGDIRIKENSTIRIRITNIWIPGSSFNVLLLR